jgi:hypothetical protein
MLVACLDIKCVSSCPCTYLSSTSHTEQLPPIQNCAHAVPRKSKKNKSNMPRKHGKAETLSHDEQGCCIQLLGGVNAGTVITRSHVIECQAQVLQTPLWGRSAELAGQRRSPPRSVAFVQAASIPGFAQRKRCLRSGLRTTRSRRRREVWTFRRVFVFCVHAYS